MKFFSLLSKVFFASSFRDLEAREGCSKYKMLCWRFCCVMFCCCTAGYIKLWLVIINIKFQCGGCFYYSTDSYLKVSSLRKVSGSTRGLGGHGGDHGGLDNLGFTDIDTSPSHDVSSHTFPGMDQRRRKISRMETQAKMEDLRKK